VGVAVDFPGLDFTLGPLNSLSARFHPHYHCQTRPVWAFARCDAGSRRPPSPSRLFWHAATAQPACGAHEASRRRHRSLGPDFEITYRVRRCPGHAPHSVRDLEVWSERAVPTPARLVRATGRLSRRSMPETSGCAQTDVLPPVPTVAGARARALASTLFSVVRGLGDCTAHVWRLWRSKLHNELPFTTNDTHIERDTHHAHNTQHAQRDTTTHLPICSNRVGVRRRGWPRCATAPRAPVELYQLLSAPAL
jgi:hypothetical protein